MKYFYSLCLVVIILVSHDTKAQNFRSLDIWPGREGSSPRDAFEYNGKLYFVATDSTYGTEWRVTEGGLATTHIIKDTTSGNQAYNPITDFTIALTKVFFWASDSSGEEPWTSDGSAYGTHRLKDIWIGRGGSEEHQGSSISFTLFNNKVYFTANDSVHGSELWVSDGADSGTHILKDIYPGAFGSTPCGSIASEYSYLAKSVIYKNKLYFSADDSIHGRELWTSDGTDSGTHIVKDIFLGTSSGNPYYIFPLDSILIFFANDSIHGYELWRSDGTDTGTYLVNDINATSSSYTYTDGSPFTYYHGKAYFNDYDGSHYKFWATDGTTSGTVSISNIVPNFFTLHPSPNGLITFHDKLYFPAIVDSIHGSAALGVSDGTDTGTFIIKLLARGQSMYYGPDNFIVYHDHLFFTSPDDSASNFKLWISDGTVSGTYTIKPIGSTLKNPLGYGNPLLVFNDELYICADFDSIGNELWIYHYDSSTVNATNYISGDNNIQAFPNPFHDNITITGLSRTENYQIHFLDMTGKICHALNTSIGAEQLNINLSDVAPGLYLIHVTGDNGNTVFKVVRE